MSIVSMRLAVGKIAAGNSVAGDTAAKRVIAA